MALALGHGGTDEDFSVVEGDNVGGCGVLQEGGVNFSAGGWSEEGDLDLAKRAGQSPDEQRRCRLSPRLEPAQG